MTRSRKKMQSQTSNPTRTYFTGKNKIEMMSIMKDLLSKYRHRQKNYRNIEK